MMLFRMGSLLLAVLASATRDTPVEKVIALLENLESEVQEEGSSQAATYNTFACYCKDTTLAKSELITNGQDTVDVESANIEAKTAEQAQKESEIQDRTVKRDELAADLKAETLRCDSRLAKLKADMASLGEARSDEGVVLSSRVSFLEARHSVEESLALAGALGINTAPATTLLQQSVDPDDPAYKFHADGIQKLLGEVLSTIGMKSKEVVGELRSEIAACTSMKESLQDGIEAHSVALAELKTDVESLTTEVAESRINLAQAEAALKDDQLYLKDLTVRCEARGKAWDQQSRTRADELAALGKALTILKDQVHQLDAVNKRSLVQQPGDASKLPSFLQARLSTVRLASRRSSSSESRDQKAAALLGVKLKSEMLTAIASRVTGDPFDKVKQLIQDLIERLLKEATEEATKKGFCDEQLGQAKMTRDLRHTDVKELGGELGVLESKQGRLQAEVAELTAAMSMLTEDLANQTAARKQEKAENLETVKKAAEGSKAVAEAITILQAFYKTAAKAKVFLEASPVDEEAPDSGLEGAYKGKQESSVGIIGILEVIQSDFDRTVQKTKAAEKEAVADFVEFDRASKVSIKEKSTQIELNKQDLENIAVAIKRTIEDMQNAQDLLDKALQTIEDLKPMCIDTGMSYKERVGKREEEIAALKRALCILDPNRVEE
eukprot:CAMPEP_0170645530 /NCGR_PEP_ID=MMETSP0224-20130122/43137_1 /TAXON_ID=285029 /ORGANISM="Togula jolla, Strain CCCM 725" /LENGTH=669 /DNA_ID=CAMNT_0010976769 /DNA_START=26 /DNA_END=2034 /DNA_ORIENTATION=-